jgi:hypothetical protein
MISGAPVDHPLEGDVRAGEPLELHFIWESNLIKQQIVAREGRSWLKFISKQTKPGKPSKFSAVTITANTPEPAQVLQGGMQVIGSTPMTLIAPVGETLSLSVATLGQEQELSVKFGPEPETLDVRFEDPSLAP